MLTNNGNIKIANLKMLFEKAKEYENGSFKGLYNFINFIDRISKNGSDMGAPKLIGENENVIRIMSIHKSKGLEFPVVFLCGTGKQFNFQDLKEDILINEDLGFGPRFIDYSKKIKYDTSAKEVLKIKEKEEILAEEMRLLYVALTRSREKLIITGIDKNVEKSFEKKQEMLENNEMKNSKLPKAIVKKGKSYLDWLEIISLYDKEFKNYIDVNFINKQNFKEEKIEQTEKNILLKQKKASNEVKKALEWTYDNIEATKLEGKSSVSEIAKDKTKEIKIDIKPKFLVDTEKITKTELGTLTHLVLQKLNFKEKYDEEKLKKLIEQLVVLEIITQKQSEAIKIEPILEFTKSELFKTISKAKEVYKEEPFYINLPAKKVYNTNIEENILVQGIIDLYFVNQENEIILVDYKTDYVPDKDEKFLTDKYKTQLELYKNAIEESRKQKVAKSYIYSTYLNKEVIFLI